MVEGQRLIVVLSNPECADDLVRYLGGHDCVAARNGQFIVELQPPRSLSEDGAREQVESDLAAWRAAHPHVEVELVG